MADSAGPSYLTRQFVFLGGLHRSGTSLLFKILRDHPDVSGFRDTGVSEDEGQLLQTVYPPARRFGGPGRFGFHAEAFLDERSELVNPANGRKLFDEWSRYWDTGKQLLLEKSPPNLVRARFLQALFPNSQFIMLLRHPIAVALATQKWSRSPLSALIEHWLICHERFADDHRYLNRLLTLKYEEFVAAPEAGARRIHDFLGLPAAAHGQQVEPDVNTKYFERWSKSVQQRPNRQRATEFLHRMEPRVNRFGYSLLAPEQVTPLADDFTRTGRFPATPAG
ncbi:MAG: sulfotransferase [Gammaproteobacteria bacterium]|nr:sulfotransferase [Gammaproteobacteria bacterium]